MKRIRIPLIVFALSFAPLCLAKSESSILSRESALIIAEKKLIEVYGKKVLKQRPFKAKELKASWFFSGTFHCPQAKRCRGGVATIEVHKKDGRIISISHGQ